MAAHSDVLIDVPSRSTPLIQQVHIVLYHYNLRARRNRHDGTLTLPSLPQQSAAQNAPIDDVTAVVLAGGQGTRIRSLFPDVPKPLIPVAGRPFLDWLTLYLAAAGLRVLRLFHRIQGQSDRRLVPRRRVSRLPAHQQSRSVRRWAPAVGC